MERSNLLRTGWARWTAFVSVGIFVLVAAATPASADVLAQSPGDSATSQSTGPGWAVDLVATLSAEDHSDGYCVDSYFDWTVADVGGIERHYDARVVRNCDVGSVTRAKWVDDVTGLTLVGVHKAGGCLVVGTDRLGRYGTRVNCDVTVGAPVAGCGSASAACYILKNGVITKTGWNEPRTAFR